VSAVEVELQAQQRRQHDQRQPAQQPVRGDLAQHLQRERAWRQRHLLQRAVGMVGGEQARQAEQRREQRRDPQHARADALQQRTARGRRRAGTG
jgi:hypothetical protein